MSLISKLTRRLNLDKKKKYHSDIKAKHNIKGNLFHHIMNGKEANSIQVTKHRNGVNVSLRYVHDSESNVIYHFKYNIDNLLLLRGVSINNEIIISDGSIPDFAISAKPVDGSCKFEWVPAHGKMKGVSLNNKLDIDYSDEHFRISQKFNAVNPAFPECILWEHNVIHEISIVKPFLEITNSCTFLQDTEIKNAYLTMLPMNTKHANKLYLSNGVIFNDIPNDGTTLKMDDTVSSAMYTGKGKKTYSAVVETNEIKQQQVVITFRKDRVTKFYLNELTGVAKKGDCIVQTQRIGCVTNSV